MIAPRTRSPLSRSALAVAWCLTAAMLAGPAALAADAPKKKDSPSFQLNTVRKDVKITAEVSPKQARPGETVTYTVHADLNPHWHIYAYAKEQVPKGPRSTQFDFFATGGLEPLGDWTPDHPAEEKPDPNFGNMVIGSYEGKVSWSRQLRVPADATPGEKSLQSQISFQICDPKRCNPPVQLSLPPVKLSVQAGDGQAAAPAPAATEETPVGAAPAVAAEAPADSPPFQIAPQAEGDEAAAAAAGEREAAPAGAAAGGSEVDRKISEGLLPFLLFSALGGLAALVMPCVWPMIPVTVNFFVKQGQSGHGKTTPLAIVYCLSIIGIFTTVGVLFSAFLGASALQRLANTAWLNLTVAFIFLAFGLSLLGLFELRLPSSLLNASAKGEGRGGLVGVIFMALTLTITSFTCTFPVVGGLLVVASRGSYLYPVMGLATFATVLALPFFLLALAPGLIKKMPRSGDWMNSVKVVGGLVEIGAAFKFLNTAEIALGATSDTAWFDAEVVLTIWVVLAAVAGLYLLGLFRTDHDHDEVRVGPIRMLSGALFLFFAIYMAPALFGSPPKSKVYNLFVGLMPPDVGDLEHTMSFVGVAPGGESAGRGEKAVSNDPEQAPREEKKFHGVAWGMSYEQAVEMAKEEGRPILIDFTGVNSANCRQMEREVMPRPEIVELLKKFVTVALYTDIVDIGSLKPDDRVELAQANSARQYEMVGDVTTPLYVIVTPEGKVVNARGGYIPAGQYKQFLEEALTKAGGDDRMARAD